MVGVQADAGGLVERLAGMAADLLELGLDGSGLGEEGALVEDWVKCWTNISTASSGAKATWK